MGQLESRSVCRHSAHARLQIGSKKLMSRGKLDSMHLLGVFIGKTQPSTMTGIVSIQVHPVVDIGAMSEVCDYCLAKKWKRGLPSMCCPNGKVHLSLLEEP